MNKVKVSRSQSLKNELEDLASSVNNAIEVGCDHYEITPIDLETMELEFFKQCPEEIREDLECRSEDLNKAITENLLAQNEFYSKILGEIQLLNNKIIRF